MRPSKIHHAYPILLYYYYIKCITLYFTQHVQLREISGISAARYTLLVFSLEDEKVEYIRRIYRNVYSYRTVIPVEVAERWWTHGVRNLRMTYDRNKDCLLIEPIDDE